MGDPLHPVEMFLHIIELRSIHEGWNEATMIQKLMEKIPDNYHDSTKHENKPPVAIWKESMIAENNSLPSWDDIRSDLMNVFGSKNSYPLNDKIKLLRSI